MQRTSHGRYGPDRRDRGGVNAVMAMRRSVALMGLLLWTVPLGLLAPPGDFVKVTLKNGQTIEGGVVSEDDQVITIETPLAAIPLAKTRIEHIEIVGESGVADRGHEAESLHTQAQAAYEKHNYREALRLSVESLMAKHPTPALPRLLIRQSSDHLLRQMTAQVQAGDFTTAIVSGVHLDEMMQTGAFREAFESPEQFAALRSNSGALLGRAYLMRAKASRQRDQLSLAASIHSDLQSAIRYAGDKSQVAAESYFELGVLLATQNRLQEAHHYIIQANALSTDSTLRIQISSLDRQLREQIAAQSARERADAFQAPPNFQPRPPAPPPTPAPTPTPPPQTLIDKAEHWMNQRAWTRAIWDYLIIFIEGGYWIWVLALAGVWFVLWRVPRWFIERRMRQGDFKAAEWRKSVRRFGIAGLIPYFQSRTRQARETKRCPHCNASLEAIEDYKNFRFDMCPSCGSQIDPLYTMDDYIEKMVKSLDGLGASSALPAGQRVVVKDAMTKLVRSIITMAVQARATDLHIEPVSDHLKFRARVDGMLFDLSTLPHRLAPNIVNSLKVMANLDIAERRVPQDGNFNLWVNGVDIDIRVSTSPVAQGESVSLRLLDHRSIEVDAAMLGLESENLAKFTKAIHSPHGLILVTGPSGSGKSTTLYVALRALNTGEKNIITIEDPVEFKVKGVNQSQINPAADFTFATALRSMLRQDPDVIMVGEIRDRDTAQLAIDASLTGHLVLTTLHTVDSSGAVPRLADLGCDPNRLAVCILSVIAQRLIRLNCTNCSAPYTPTQSLLEELEMPLPSDDLKYYKGRGCSRCNQSGYYGRTGIFEILMPNDKLRDAIEKRVTSMVIRDLACSAGMRTLREEGLLKIIQGKTTLEEILRVTAL